MFDDDWFTGKGASAGFIKRKREELASKRTSAQQVASATTAPAPKKKKDDRNLAQKIAGGVGNFVKDAALDIKDTTVDTYQGVGDIARGQLAARDVRNKTKIQDERNKEYQTRFGSAPEDKWKDPNFVAEAKKFTDETKKLAEVSANTRQDLKTEQKVDAKKLGFEAAETALNVGTAGLGSITKAAAKQVGKQITKAAIKRIAKTGGIDAAKGVIRKLGQGGTKELAQEAIESASKRLAGNVAKDATVGAAYGVTQTGKNNPDADVDDYLVNAAFGAGIGAVVPVAGAAIKKGFKSAKGAISGKPKSKVPVDKNDVNAIINQSIEEQSDKYGKGALTRAKEFIGDQGNPFRALSKLDDAYAKKMGIKRTALNADESLEDLARRSAAAEREAAGLFEVKTPTGQSAKDLVMKYKGDSPEGMEFNNYTNAKFDLEFREKHGGKRIQQNLEDDQLKSFVTDYESRNADAVSDLKTKKSVNDMAVDYLVKTKVISKEEGATIKGSYENAVPLERVFPDDLARPEVTGRNIGSIAKQTVVQRLEGGSDIPLSNSFDALLNRVYKAVSQGNRAKLAQKLLERHEAGLVPGSKIAVTAGNKEARASIRENVQLVNKAVRVLNSKVVFSNRQARRLESELNKLNIEGLNTSLKQVQPKTPQAPVKTVTVKTVAPLIKENAPKTLDDLKQSYGTKAMLLKEYGPGKKGIQQMAADIHNGGYSQLMDLNPKMSRATAESIADQILKKPTIVPGKTVVTEGYDTKYNINKNAKEASISSDDVKTIVSNYRKRFDDNNIRLENPNSPTALGAYSYQDDMIRVARGKDDVVDTFDHESVHKAMAQFLSDKEIESLYKDIVKVRGGKKSLKNYYRSNGYSNISWRGAAEEEIANTFIYFLKQSDRSIGSVGVVKLAEKLRLPETVVRIMDKLIQNIRKEFGGDAAQKRLNTFYSKLNQGTFKGAERRKQKYVEPLGVKDKTLNTAVKVAQSLPISDNVYDKLLNARYGSAGSKLRVSQPSTKNLIKSLLKMPTGDVERIKAKIARREPKLAGKIDEVLNYKAQIDSLKVAKTSMKEVTADFTDDPTTGKQVISGVIDGQSYKLEVPPDLAKALQGLDQQKLPPVLKALAIVKKPFEVAWTGILNPVFSAMSFAFYDTPMSIINSPQGFKTLAPKAVIESIKSLRSSSDFQRRLAAEGARPYGGSGASTFVKPNAKALAAQRSILSRIGYASSHPERALSALDVWGGKLANMTRTRVARAAYDAALKRGASPKQAIENATLAYRTIMPDFDTMSNLTRQINSVVPFYAASIAGTRSFAQALRRDPLNTSAKALALGIAPAVGITAFSLMSPNGQEFYRDMQESGNTKLLDDNMVVVLPGAHKDPKTGEWTGIIKVPLAPEFRAINQSVWRSVRGAMGGEGPGASNIALSIFDTATGGVRSSENPLISTRRILSGEDPRTGERIIKGDMANLPKEEQLYDSTSGAGKFVGGVLNTSPIQGDKILGQFGLAGSTVKNGGKPVKAITENVGNRFEGARGESASNSFYEAYSPVRARRDRASKKATDLVKAGKLGEARRRADEYNETLKGAFNQTYEKYGKSSEWNSDWEDMIQGLFIKTSNDAFKARVK